MVKVTPQNSLQCPEKCGRWTAKVLRKHLERHHPDHPDVDLSTEQVADKYKVTDEEFEALRAEDERKDKEFEEAMLKRRVMDARTSQLRTTVKTNIPVIAKCSTSSGRTCAVCGKRVAVKTGLRCKGCLARARRLWKVMERMSERKGNKGENQGNEKEKTQNKDGGTRMSKEVVITVGEGTVTEPFELVD